MLRKILGLIGMKFRSYSNPSNVGWLGWLESRRGNCLGFIRPDGTILFDW